MVIEEFFVTDDVPGIFNRHAKNFKENVNIFRKKTYIKIGSESFEKFTILLFLCIFFLSHWKLYEISYRNSFFLNLLTKKKKKILGFYYIIHFFIIPIKTTNSLSKRQQKWIFSIQCLYVCTCVNVLKKIRKFFLFNTYIENKKKENLSSWQEKIEFTHFCRYHHALILSIRIEVETP